jgi:hypothetical protein
MARSSIGVIAAIFSLECSNRAWKEIQSDATPRELENARSEIYKTSQMLHLAIVNRPYPAEPLPADDIIKASMAFRDAVNLINGDDDISRSMRQQIQEFYEAAEHGSDVFVYAVSLSNTIDKLNRKVSALSEVPPETAGKTRDDAEERVWIAVREMHLAAMTLKTYHGRSLLNPRELVDTQPAIDKALASIREDTAYGKQYREQITKFRKDIVEPLPVAH